MILYLLSQQSQQKVIDSYSASETVKSHALEKKMRKYSKSLKISLCLKLSNSITENLPQNISVEKNYIQKDAYFGICKVVNKMETN